MNTRYCMNSERGVTLIELIVTLGLTSLLLVFVISGVLFMQRYINVWQHEDLVAEDTAYLAATLSDYLEHCRALRNYEDSLVFEHMDGSSSVFRRTNSALYYRSRSLLRAGLRLDSLAISQFSLPMSSEDTLLFAGHPDDVTGLYYLVIAVSGPQAADTFVAIVRNNYVYHKFTP